MDIRYRVLGIAVMLGLFVGCVESTSHILDPGESIMVVAATCPVCPTCEPTDMPESTATPAVATYYVAEDGDDGALGTQEEPFATLGRALDVASDGDTVHMMAGMHDLGGAMFDLDRRIVLQGDGAGESMLTNGGGFSLQTGVEIRDLAFSDFDALGYAYPVFTLGDGASIDGLIIERVAFEHVAGVLWGRDFTGQLTDMRFANNRVMDLVTAWHVRGIMVYGGTIRDVSIVENTFANVRTTSEEREAFVLFIGSNDVPTEHVTVTGNVIEGVTGGTLTEGYPRAARGIVLYGDYHVVEGNVVREINRGEARSCIYVKGSHMRIVDNVVENCGNVGYSGALAIKGVGNVDNIVEGNCVINDYEGNAGIGILTKGEAAVVHNYVWHPAEFGFGLYSYELADRRVDILDNYIEASGWAVSVFDAKEGECTGNTIISYRAKLVYLSGASVDVHDNQECVGYNCPIMDPDAWGCAMGY